MKRPDTIGLQLVEETFTYRVAVPLINNYITFGFLNFTRIRRIRCALPATCLTFLNKERIRFFITVNCKMTVDKVKWNFVYSLRSNYIGPIRIQEEDLQGFQSILLPFSRIQQSLFRQLHGDRTTERYTSLDGFPLYRQPQLGVFG